MRKEGAIRRGETERERERERVVFIASIGTEISIE
jgi:hypothetical protein